MKADVVDTRKLYCPRFPQPEVLILISVYSDTECVKAREGECPYVNNGKTCRYHSVGGGDSG